MIDLRLLAPALAAWGGSLTTLIALSTIEPEGARHSVAVRVIQVLIVITPVLAWLSRRRGAALVSVAAGGLAVVASAAQIAAWTAPAVVESMQNSQNSRNPVVLVGTVAGPAREALGGAYVPIATDRIIEQNSEKPATAVSIPVTASVPRFSQVPPAGTSVQVTGRLRPAGGSVTTAAYLDADSELIVVGEASPVDRAAHRVRESLTLSLPASPPGGSALVAGLAIGDERQMSPELIEQMRMSGLSHLTAVSGGNVAIAVGAIAGVAWLLRLPMIARIVVSLVALGFYVVVVHPQPSVLRAGVMGAVVVLSLLVGGRRPGPSILATAVLILVVISPSLSVSWGFALSVAATAGIVLIAPLLKSRIEDTAWGERIPTAVTLATTITLAAQLATAPVLLAMGAYVGIAAIPANVLAMPVVPLITIAGLAAAMVGVLPFGQIPAQLLAWVGAWAGEWIAQVAQVASGVDVLRIRGSPMGAIVFLGVVPCGLALWRLTARPRFRPLRMYAMSMVAATIIGALVWWLAPPGQRSWPPSGWVMTQCDVGQGDGLVIAPDGEVGAVVVDTGVSARVMDECLTDLGIDHISALVLTHFHADHVSGLAGVIDGRRVDAVFATVLEEPHEQFEGVAYELARRGLTLDRLTAGATVRIGSGEYRVLWPRRIITSGRVSEGSVANNASVVLDARVHGVRLLLTGDIEPPAQAALLGGPGDFDIVKVPHHGSRHQHPDFAGWAQAEIALVSVGKDNGFGHPAPGTVQAWTESGARVLRTDLAGDIAIVKNDDDAIAFSTRRDMLGPR